MEENTGLQQADEIAAVASKADFAIYFGDANDYAYDDSSCEKNVFVLFCSALDITQGFILIIDFMLLGNSNFSKL